jgi:hypothetical protein
LPLRCHYLSAPLAFHGSAVDVLNEAEHSLRARSDENAFSAICAISIADRGGLWWRVVGGNVLDRFVNERNT